MSQTWGGILWAEPKEDSGQDTWGNEKHGLVSKQQRSKDTSFGLEDVRSLSSGGEKQ